MKFRIQPIECSADIVDFANTMIVFTLTQSRATKIKAKHREPERMQRLHRMKHDFVVQSSAKQWVRMANQSRVRSVLRPSVQQRFEPSRRTLKK